jgi:hypothetical protein
LWLYGTVIPDLVEKWETLFEKWNNQANNNAGELVKLPAFQKWKLPFETHIEGINMRHLGRIREKVKNPTLAMVVLSEMIARYTPLLLPLPLLLSTFQNGSSRSKHTEGINMRHLGRIRAQVKNPTLAMVIFKRNDS